MDLPEHKYRSALLVANNATAGHYLGFVGCSSIWSQNTTDICRTRYQGLSPVAKQAVPLSQIPQQHAVTWHNTQHFSCCFSSKQNYWDSKHTVFLQTFFLDTFISLQPIYLFCLCIEHSFKIQFQSEIRLVSRIFNKIFNLFNQVFNLRTEISKKLKYVLSWVCELLMKQRNK